MTKSNDNPAKLFLQRYLALSGQVDALQRAIDKAMERAKNTSVTPKEIKVCSSPAEPDLMAKDVCNAVDACEILYEYKAKAVTALQEIMSAIDSLEDERQKQVLIMRYVSGDGFTDIQEKMHYEKTQMFKIHGRALAEINKWLDNR